MRQLPVGQWNLPSFRSNFSILGITVIFGMVTSASAFAERYRVDIVAQIGTVIDGYTIMEIPRDGDYPIINDHGEVVFTARVTGPGGYDDYAVLTNRRMIAKIGDVIDGQPITWLADESINPKINNQGQVAYSAVFGSPECCISGGVYKLVLDNHIAAEPGMTLSGNVIDSVPNNFKLDNLGQLVFTANAGDGAGVYSQHGLLLGPGDEIDGHRLTSAVAHAVSPGGEIVFKVMFDDGAEPFRSYGSLATKDEVLLNAGTVLDGNRTVYGISGLWMDGDRRILAQLSTEGVNGIKSELYLIPGGPLSDETVLGPLSVDYMLASNPMPLPDGRFAFTALPSDGLSMKLFAGDELISSRGEILGGKAVDRFDFEGEFDVSGAGNMTMHVVFADRTRGILAATVIPEPSTIISVLFAAVVILSTVALRRLGNRWKSALWLGLPKVEPQQRPRL
jgi:hypothetical protein